MVEVVTHTDESRSGGVSPFAVALASVAQSGELRIACPYISLDYLEGRLLPLASEWRLVTDAHEWLSACGSRQARAAALEFLRSQGGRTRDLPRLHAKVAIGADRALVGSANLTKDGLRSNEELALLVTDAETVRALATWYEGVWSHARVPDTDALGRLVQRYARRDSLLAGARLPGRRPSGIHAALPEGPKAVEEQRRRLVKLLRRAPGRNWARELFRLGGEALAKAELSSDDPRLVTTAPNGTRLHITIGRRIVLGWHPEWLGAGGLRDVLEFILPPEWRSKYPESVQLVRGPRYEFRSAGGARGRPDPVLERLQVPDLDESRLPYLDLWRQEMLHETSVCARPSPYRRHHQPLVCRALRDRAFLEALLDEAGVP